MNQLALFYFVLSVAYIMIAGSCWRAAKNGGLSQKVVRWISVLFVVQTIGALIRFGVLLGVGIPTNASLIPVYVVIALSLYVFLLVLKENL